MQPGNEAYYRTIVESQTDLIDCWYPDTTLIFVNQTWCRFFGGSPEDWIGKSIYTLTPEEDKPALQAHITQFLQSNPDYPEATIEVRGVLPNGDIRWFQWHEHAIFNEQNQIVCVQGVGKDITEQLDAERELKRLAREAVLLNQVISTTSSSLNPEKIMEILCAELAKNLGVPQAAYAQLAPDKKSTKVIAEYCESGRPSALGVTIPLSENQITEYVLNQRAPLAVLDAQHDPRHVAFHEIAKERGTVSLLVIPVIVQDEVIGTIGLDAIEHRKFTLEEINLVQNATAAASQALANAILYETLQIELAERKKAEKHISHLNENLERSIAELRRSNADLQQFAYVASHDLQEPLRKVIAFGDLLQNKHASLLDEVAKSYLERIQSATRRMQTMILDLLLLSRVTTSGQPFAPADLNQIAQEVVADLEVRLNETQGLVEIGDLPVIEADATQMHQLFANLINNALKFHRPDVAPHVTVVAEMDEDNHGLALCILRVADNGIGFEEKYLEQIFQPFQRLHGRSEYEGTGMGLAICRKIVERHKGSIIAQSILGQGSTFIITLPISQRSQEN